MKAARRWSTAAAYLGQAKNRPNLTIETEALATKVLVEQGRAVGIVQALPASKMKSAGADYLTNPYTQIKWGLKYIRTRYNNNACWALRHELNRGWY